VDTRPGAFEVAWERAFGDYSATYPGHWRRSSTELAALLKAYPQFKGAQPYASWAQAEARVEPLPQQRPTLTPTIAAILGALAALALALIVVTLYRAARATPRKRHTLPIAYPPSARPEQADAATLLDALDDRLTPAAQRMN
jgi:hypothetical protein